MITKSVQMSVDRYIELNAQKKTIEDELKALREVIEPFMDTKSLDRIAGSVGGAVALQFSERAPLTARYTSYELDIVSEFLSPKVKKKVVVERIDKDLLESLVKLGEVPQDLLSLKMTTKTKSLVIKK